MGHSDESGGNLSIKIPVSESSAATSFEYCRAMVTFLKIFLSSLDKTHLINRLDSRIDFDIQSGHLNKISRLKFSRLKIFISNVGFCIRCDL